MVLLLRESMSTPPWGPFGGPFFYAHFVALLKERIQAEQHE